MKVTSMETHQKLYLSVGSRYLATYATQSYRIIIKNMTKVYRPGAVGALLDEYERALRDLQRTIDNITNDELIRIVDSKTRDTNCKSVQTVLSHVVSAGYGYAVYIRRFKGHQFEIPPDEFRPTISEYHKDLDSLFDFTSQTFKDVQENEIEQHDNERKMMTAWGQTYDVEQITEHGIVHILRHRRQIEKFKLIMRKQQ